jgi:hypothetical protein
MTRLTVVTPRFLSAPSPFSRVWSNDYKASSHDPRRLSILCNKLTFMDRKCPEDRCSDAIDEWLHPLEAHGWLQPLMHESNRPAGISSARS